MSRIFGTSYYRFPGVLAVVALLIYTTVMVALFKLIPITLTLAGIAGFILSIGIAVDANILIFERMKEELRAGKTLQTAVETGFKRAFPSIRDSNTASILKAESTNDPEFQPPDWVIQALDLHDAGKTDEARAILEEHAEDLPEDESDQPQHDEDDQRELF